uniref:Clorobiocin biosynthesis protein CloN5 n=1 Tax=Candidatus Kentrum sp. FW TaxID=2126338 RepID=A0A450SLG1_9GAMM|nr:MAG: clorobiocin biosynthesis protein CloN5 [Candidatus Kentron sp. FW]VFJ54467.1 MAG: clorobiocin biosynthesis protein CloN5 [Candidatus Kentron sp. FW]
MGNSNPTRAEIETAIKEYITEAFLYDRQDVSLTNDFPLFEQGIIDSMGLFRLISFLEEKFGFAVKPEEILIESFSSVDTITTLVEESMGR